MKHWHIAKMLGILIAGMIGVFYQGAPRAIAADAGYLKGQNGVEVLTRGPVHEAFAEPNSYNPTQGFVMPKEAPAVIEEIPPDEKPAGDALWIPGYWQWDSERSDFIWISGIWRVPSSRVQLGSGLLDHRCRGFHLDAGVLDGQRSRRGHLSSPTPQEPGSRTLQSPLREPIIFGPPDAGLGRPATSGGRVIGYGPVPIGSGRRHTMRIHRVARSISMDTGTGQSTAVGCSSLRCISGARPGSGRIMSIPPRS